MNTLRELNSSLAAFESRIVDLNETSGAGYTTWTKALRKSTIRQEAVSANFSDNLNLRTLRMYRSQISKSYFNIEKCCQMALSKCSQ